MADNVVNGVKVPFLPVRGVDSLKERPSLKLPVDRSFEEVFRKELDSVKFSKHAQQRLDERNIRLSETDMAQLKSAVENVEVKGGRDSLILLRDIAFIVNIKNKTVVTAIDGERLKDNVFTNIDSAVIAEK